MVKVLPEPVTPSSTWSRSPARMPAISCVIASGWSPAGPNAETISKALPPAAAVPSANSAARAMAAL